MAIPRIFAIKVLTIFQKNLYLFAFLLSTYKNAFLFCLNMRIVMQVLQAPVLHSYCKYTFSVQFFIAVKCARKCRTPSIKTSFEISTTNLNVTRMLLPFPYSAMYIDKHIVDVHPVLFFTNICLNETLQVKVQIMLDFRKNLGIRL